MIARQKEVVDIMEMLFSREEVWQLDRREIADEAHQEGIALMGELMRQLEPLGRIGDLELIRK